MRKPYVVGNWKMHTTRSEALSLAVQVALATSATQCDVAICVPFPHLGPVRDSLVKGTHLLVGAQDVFWEPAGAYTGAVSVGMLGDYCDVVIIGHSERRRHFGETDQTVNRKLVAVLGSMIAPILCVGETLVERQAGQTEVVIRRQLAGGLEGIKLSSRLTIAYEPVWAIGNGQTATPEDVQRTCSFIRRWLRSFGAEVADQIRIQYGGSVSVQNAKELLSLPDVDGALVGGASLRAADFVQICALAS